MTVPFPGPVETVYFGGGTPSLLEQEEILSLITAIRARFAVTDDAEITLEANPDDIDETVLRGWRDAGINRLSIGVQSFFEEDLQWMNRAHNATQAKAALELAIRFFPNITMDLIYGTPGLTDEKWKQNVDTVLSLSIPHISCYALTVEPMTPLQKLIRQKKMADVDPDQQSAQFLLLMEWLREAGYEHYEISNFAKPGFRSRHNSAYWKGIPYSGLGPAAHSFDGRSRWWNVANNQTYIQQIAEGKIPSEKETLTTVQLINERLMIALRTIEGFDMDSVSNLIKEFPESVQEKISTEWRKKTASYMREGLMVTEANVLRLTDKGKLFADGIAADFFLD